MENTTFFTTQIRQKNCYASIFFVHDFRPVSIDLEDETNSSLDCIDVDSFTRVKTLANIWGSDVLEIERDGNCFFTALAVLIKSLREGNTMSEVLKDHLHSIDINDETPVEELPDRLRALIVEE